MLQKVRLPTNILAGILNSSKSHDFSQPGDIALSIMANFCAIVVSIDFVLNLQRNSNLYQ